MSTVKTSVNSILLRRASKIAITQGNWPIEFSERAKQFVATFNRNIEGLGYTFSKATIERLLTVSPLTLQTMAHEVITALQDLRGVRNYKPMYPNFPTQVMEASNAELYFNAILHYLDAWIGDVNNDYREVWLPRYAKDPRPTLADVVRLEVIDLGTEQDLADIIGRIVASNTSISDTDKADVEWFIENQKFVLPAVIPNKENLAFAVAALIKTGKLDVTKLRDHIKTATDVLRLAVAMSKGDVSLAKPAKFRSFTRRERKALLTLLENTGSTQNITEDMLRWDTRWIALGEKLHPGDYAHLYPSLTSAFDVIRNKKPFDTFNGSVEKLLVGGPSAIATAQLLATRPGDFARRLDHVLRTAGSMTQRNGVVSRFEDVADKVSTPVLLQVMAHFKYRFNKSPMRVFFPKGNIAKVQAIANNLPPIETRITNYLVDVCASVLAQRFSALPSLGKVYVDPNLAGYLIPFSQRSASRALHTVVRGSHIPFDEGNTIRFFMWWKDAASGRTDLDLSAVMYDDNWQYKEHISYTNLRSTKYQAAHSGDITSAPNGACEFIDIDVESVLRYGGRYVVACVNCFTSHKFSELPECHVGWMMRQKPKSGEVFDARTVQNRIDVTSESTICMPAVFDLEKREIIWADAALKKNAIYYNNVEGNADQISLIGQAFTHVHKPNLYDLFMLHASGRGQIVSSPRYADTVFSVEAGTPFQLETIAADFMQDAPQINKEEHDKGIWLSK